MIYTTGPRDTPPPAGYFLTTDSYTITFTWLPNTSPPDIAVPAVVPAPPSKDSGGCALALP